MACSALKGSYESEFRTDYILLASRFILQNLSAG